MRAFDLTVGILKTAAVIGYIVLWMFAAVIVVKQIQHLQRVHTVHCVPTPMPSNAIKALIDSYKAEDREYYREIVHYKGEHHGGH